MANLAAYTLRGLGVPVAIDFVPCWGNMNSGHVWNSLVTKDNKVLPFLGAEGNIGDYNPLYLVGILEDNRLSTYKKPGKVYRKTFSIQRESLAYKYRKTTLLPSHLADARIIDITQGYVPVTDVTIDSKNIGLHPELLFICNYNSGAWIPIMAAENKNGQYHFADMGRDMLYHAYSSRVNMILNRYRFRCT